MQILQVLNSNLQSLQKARPIGQQKFAKSEFFLIGTKSHKVVDASLFYGFEKFHDDSTSGFELDDF